MYEKKIIKCVLCNIKLPDENALIEKHVDSDNHKILYIERLFLRNGMTFSGRDGACQICDIARIPDLKCGEHIRSLKHQSVLEQIKTIIQKDGDFIDLPRQLPVNALDHTGAKCLICDRDILFRLPDILKHISLASHKSARCMALQPLNGIVSVVDSDSKDGEKDCNVLWCKICKVYFDNYVESIFEHVDNDKTHITNMTKLINLIEGQDITIEKFLINPKEDKAQCNKCNKEIPCNLDNLTSHIDKHRTSR